MRALFIYWGVQPTELPAALATAHALQAQLLRRMPTLSAHLYQRVDTPGAVVTVMETYSSTGGLGEQALSSSAMATPVANREGRISSIQWVQL